MSKRNRFILHISGLLLFAIIASYAIYNSPPDLSKIKSTELFAGFLLSALAIYVQGLQISIFLQNEVAAKNPIWTTWIVAEKAWVNSIFPAKAGTMTSLLVMQKKWNISWLDYSRFIFFCGLVTGIISIFSAIILIFPYWSICLAVSCILALAISILQKIAYPLSYKNSVYIVGLAILTILILSAGIGACIHGLGYTAELKDYIAIGITLNLLSIISVTPGNFGIREICLGLLSPLLPISFEAIIQGATCYVVLRLLASLLIASVTRPIALSNSG